MIPGAMANGSENGHGNGNGHHDDGGSTTTTTTTTTNNYHESASNSGLIGALIAIVIAGIIWFFFLKDKDKDKVECAKEQKTTIKDSHPELPNLGTEPPPRVCVPRS